MQVIQRIRRAMDFDLKAQRRITTALPVTRLETCEKQNSRWFFDCRSGHRKLGLLNCEGGGGQGGPTNMNKGLCVYVYVCIRKFSKSQKLQFLSNVGTTLLKGSLQDEESLLETVKIVDVVICAVSSKQALDQKLLVWVIKNLGSFKVVNLPLVVCLFSTFAYILYSDGIFQKKKKCIEIIPENAEFEQVRSLGEESLGDESLYEDDGNDKGTSE
ncbi:hypothetical protein POM88_002882 [Heracleum sosnowskyi]|uniref:NmrA-like domain-containing protein n=1 Tax=Heracleum sosnowskyi TaxID=360622 RepID=A0AAD8NBS6_9APIA|nr:hypothetical protein POM88_002882 [Heracleum sosnowskyi]